MPAMWSQRFWSVARDATKREVALRFGRDYGPDPPVQLQQWLDATARLLAR